MRSSGSVELVPWLTGLRHVAQNRTLARAAFNHAVCDHVHVAGAVIDLGGGPAASYRPLLQGATSITTLDGAAPGADHSLDLEVDPLPMAEATVDTVLAFNLLEHLFEHRRLLEEAARVLRADGRFFVWVPFLIGYHPDPEDHFRYTSTTLVRLLESSGFRDVAVHGYGGRFTAAANIALGGIPGRLLRLVVAASGLALDRAYYRFARNSTPEGFPLGYLASARAATGSA